MPLFYYNIYNDIIKFVDIEGNIDNGNDEL